MKQFHKHISTITFINIIPINHIDFISERTFCITILLVFLRRSLFPNLNVLCRRRLLCTSQTAFRRPQPRKRITPPPASSNADSIRFQNIRPFQLSGTSLRPHSGSSVSSQQHPKPRRSSATPTYSSGNSPHIAIPRPSTAPSGVYVVSPKATNTKLYSPSSFSPHRSRNNLKPLHPVHSPSNELTTGPPPSPVSFSVRKPLLFNDNEQTTFISSTQLSPSAISLNKNRST
ncbi:hypothetical protein GEMRC1_003601 [Eukaryota sp. GEM-RC1]